MFLAGVTTVFSLSQATPSTVRRTRSSAKLQATPVQLEESGEGPAPSAAPSTKNRHSRVLEPHSPQQGSIHDADTSDLDSCCSVEFAAATQTRATRRKTQRRNHESDISDVESCSSAASKPGCGTPRRTRRTTGSESSGAHPPEVGGATVDPPVEVRSGGPVRLESQRVTRRSTRSKTPAKRQPADSELSEPDSCTSSVSERTFRRQKRSIPVHTDQLAESSPVRTLRQTRATRSRVASTVSEPPSCDSEGFESGPSSSLSTRKKGKVQSAKVLDSESEEVDLHSPVSPCSTGSRTTPCSSRASSGTASRRRPLSRISAESRAMVVESDESLNDSKLETTVIAAEDTLLEEETVKLTEEQNDVNDDNLISKEARKEKTDVPECDENDDSGPAVMAKGQQREPSAEGNAGDSSEMETMQGNISSSEASRSVTVSFCEKVPEMMEVEEKQGLTVDTSLLDTEKETPPCEEEEKDMEVCSLKPDAQQVEDIQELSEAAPESKQQPKPFISLLDSSDEDEELDEEAEEVSKQEDLDHEEQERGGTSSKSKPAAASVGGLFVIDTRPGQDPDQQYYTDWKGEEEEDENKRSEKEQDEDEFVDEEEEEDKDADILWSSRNSHL